jgi:cell division septum initiation protein DivIVA
MGDELENGGKPEVEQPAASDTPQPETKPVENTGDSAGVPQEKVNELVGKTRQEAREKARAEFLQSLGFEDEGALKALLDDAKKRKEAEMTEVEKLTAKLQELQAQAKQAQDAAAAATQQARMERLTSAVKSAASEANATYPDDVVTLLRDRGELESMLDDDGNVKAKAVTSAIEKVKQDRPAYFTRSPQQPGSPSNNDGLPPDVLKKKREEAQSSFAQLLKF